MEQLLAQGRDAFRKFSTVLASGKLFLLGDLGYYEVEVLHAGRYTQFGFCSLEWPARKGYSRKGVGDDDLSWGVDGDRALKWHEGSNEAFGGWWRAGDVVGLACDLRDGGRRMLVSLNGDYSPPYGAAFDLPLEGLEGGLCPTLSARTGCNLGAGRLFRHAPPSPECLAMVAMGALDGGGYSDNGGNSDGGGST